MFSVNITLILVHLAQYIWSFKSFMSAANPECWLCLSLFQHEQKYKQWSKSMC